MKAIVLQNYGGPEVLQWTETSDPMVPKGSVLVRVAATSINPIDSRMRSGAVQAAFPLSFPAVIGLDVSGTVQALGEGVTSFQVGDQVFGKADRTYAELCVVPSDSLAKVPDGLDLIAAAALPVVTITGNMLASATGAEAGRTVLVTGAAGNVGRSAVYTLKARGVRVIAAVKKDQLALSDLGADEAVATDDDAAMSQLPTLDAVADTVGGTLAEKLLTKVKVGGTFASVLGAPANATEHPGVRIEAVYAFPNPEILTAMAQAVITGQLKIPIASQMPLMEAAKAHELGGKAGGKIVLVADPGDPTRSEAEHKIRELLHTYNKALNSSNTGAVLPLYTQDGIFMAPYSPSAVGQDSVRTAYERVFQMLKFDVVFTVVELVILTPEWAYARTASAGHTTNPATGKQSSEGNQELFVFRKEAGKAWKIARYSFSPVQPPSA